MRDYFSKVYYNTVYLQQYSTRTRAPQTSALPVHHSELAFYSFVLVRTFSNGAEFLMVHFYKYIFAPLKRRDKRSCTPYLLRFNLCLCCFQKHQPAAMFTVLVNVQYSALCSSTVCAGGARGDQRDGPVRVDRWARLDDPLQPGRHPPVLRALRCVTHSLLTHRFQHEYL